MDVAVLGSEGGAQQCGYIFKTGDIAWVCRTCQTDDTCVLCQECFSNSNHEGHDVFFHRTRSGGCCDCGDLEAWKAEGCCPRHRGGKSSTDTLPDALTTPARLIADAVVHYVHSVMSQVQLTFDPMAAAAVAAAEASEVTHVHGGVADGTPATVAARGPAVHDAVVGAAGQLTRETDVEARAAADGRHREVAEEGGAFAAEVRGRMHDASAWSPSRARSGRRDSRHALRLCASRMCTCTLSRGLLRHAPR